MFQSIPSTFVMVSFTLSCSGIDFRILSSSTPILSDSWMILEILLLILNRTLLLLYLN